MNQSGSPQPSPSETAPRSMLGLTIIGATVTMVAFAANSVLCRLALGGGEIDAASFSTIRLVSGAVVLWLIVRIRSAHETGESGRWSAAAALFLYAVPFSLAYLSLSAGTGALILFGCVQMTMLAAALSKGERLAVVEWAGFAAAIAGLVYLVFPGLEAPSIAGALLMATAGVAWGVYTLLGKGAADPIAATAGNFLRTVPAALILPLCFLGQLDVTTRGIILAVISGAVTSGMGYSLWYATLRHLTATRAALIQLSVPVIVSIGGVLFLSENLTTRLMVSSVLILGGIAVAILGKRR